jgi:carbon storage regulator|tara:strand:+ start:962 stop:1228 length:267 start_codon:yes stop_codon:yes gene_type:complete
MLVVSRKKGEAIIINDDIEIIVSEIKGSQVKLGVQTSKKNKVYRKELYLKIKQANESSLNFDPSDIGDLKVKMEKKTDGRNSTREGND